MGGGHGGEMKEWFATAIANIFARGCYLRYLIYGIRDCEHCYPCFVVVVVFFFHSFYFNLTFTVAPI